MLACEDVGYQLLGERAQFDVCALGAPFEYVEGGGGRCRRLHQHALCLFDDGSVVGDFGEGFGDAFLALVALGVTSR